VLSMLRPPIKPMLARAVDELPYATGLSGGCAYEPKLDGYRALLFVSETGCVVQSRRGKNITASFPDISAAATAQLPTETIIDGELAILGADGRMEFSALQRRLAATRTAATLASSQPASFVAFDALWAPCVGDLRDRGFAERRSVLERLLADSRPPLQLSPQTTDYDVAAEWMRQYAAAPVGLEGVVAKGLADPYRSDHRGWLKVRVRDTTEAIVGAVTGTLTAPDRLILGRLDDAGALQIVGTTAPLRPRQQAAVGPLLRPPPDDTHPWPTEIPAGRYGSKDRITVQLVEPTLVVEIAADNAYDHGRWRHLTRFIRVRSDLTPEQVGG
jgi:ATP-dependent DNA ligase